MPALTDGPKGRDAQPLSHVEWVDPSELRANNYNPNSVAPPELELLRESILSSGWTQPIVARTDGEIVDGFHRWTVASTNPDVAAIGDGCVPVVRLPDAASKAEQIAATVRHNRARGSHHVLKMADIAAILVDDLGISPEDMAEAMGMEDEEVERLLDRGRVDKRLSREDGSLNKAWVPINYSDAAENPDGVL